MELLDLVGSDGINVVSDTIRRLAERVVSEAGVVDGFNGVSLRVQSGCVLMEFWFD